MSSTSEQRLAQLYDRWAGNVHAYALRHCGADAADDVVSETFLVAWRRIDDVPADELPWLLVVARHVVSNQRRSDRRRDHLTAAASQQPVVHAVAAGDLATQRIELLEALGTLSELEREALLLVNWDGLTLAAAAKVAGCRERAFRARLARARERFRRALDEPPPTERDHDLQPQIRLSGQSEGVTP